MAVLHRTLGFLVDGPDPAILDALRVALQRNADPVRAAAQQAYMKSAMPYYGLAMPHLRRLVRTVLDEHPFSGRASWLASVRTLWDGATHREQRYAAIAVLRDQRCAAWLRADESLLDLLRHLIVTGAWWDLVDDLAHVVGALLRTDPAVMVALLRSWSREENLWLRRSSIVSQLGARSATDTELLRDVIEGSITDRDFFARKAIGWALREYSKTDPAWVREYVREHAGRLSALSQREALKWLAGRPTGDHLSPAPSAGGIGVGLDQ